jgi:hypothetical protein
MRIFVYLIRISRINWFRSGYERGMFAGSREDEGAAFVEFNKFNISSKTRVA